MTLEQLEKFDAARAAYEKAIAAKPDAMEGYYHMGVLLDRMGDGEAGIQWLLKGLAIEPNNAALNYDIGVIYAKRQDYANSALYSGAAAKSDPRLAEAHNNYAYALANLGRYQEALVAVDRAILLKPNNAASLDTRGFTLHGLKRYAEALADYDKALALDGEISEIYLHRAQTLEAMGRVAEAVAAYEQYLKQAPEAPERADVEKSLLRLRPTTTPASRAASGAASSAPQPVTQSPATPVNP